MSDDLIERLRPPRLWLWLVPSTEGDASNIRKWSHAPFDEGVEYIRADEAAARIEALTAEVERLRGAFGPIMRHFEVETRDGNAPGHGHTIPGIWDAGNAPDLAGYKCHWCREWNEARAALKDTSPEPKGE